MREILFRGKRKDNGEWVYGDLIHRKIWSSELYIIRVEDNGFESYIEYEVIPETVGQYTGLTDKNGKKIFEGDICSSKGMIYQIIWLDDKYGWFCKVLKSNSCLIDTSMAFPLYQYDNRPENGYRQLNIIVSVQDKRKDAETH